MKKEMIRLSKDIIPSNYNISIEPSIETSSYTGSVTIKAEITKPAKNIILHSRNSKIKTTTICVGTQCLLPKVKEDKESETITLEVQKEIKGDIEIHIEFSGVITDDLAGIYLSTYEHKGKKEYLITTQCEAPYARRIFPCFDEPGKKATFDISVIIEKNFKAVSNMLPKSEQIEKNKKKVQFKTTPKMSTYLFYLGIGDFEFAEDKYKDTIIRVVTTPGKTKNAKFALTNAKRYLEYFENYSEIHYPLEKLDLIAVPDFTVGGMENWGAITFRELILLIDEEKSSTSRKRIAAEVISHELWHQWSGDLVTMEWWNDLWLNESFANYMAFKAVTHYNPEWKMWDDYLSGDLALGLFKDSLRTTHPIEVAVNSPEEIDELFDEISYQKGGSVLRMLDNYMGEESFRIGVSNYLKKYSYSNAKASDLWNCLDEVSKNKKIKELMKVWISQEGYPLVSIEKVKTGLKISQERCNKKTNQLWPIPLSICTEDICHNVLLEKKEQIYSIKEQYIKANHEQLAFYRTKYSKELLNNLGSMVKEKRLAPQDRWGVHNDLWALSNLLEEDLEDYLSFLNNYLDETSYIILVDISSNIRKLDRLYYHEVWWPKVKEKIIKKILPIYKSQLDNLGWDNKESDSTEDRLMRSLCISFCGFADDKKTILESQARYAKGNFELDIAGQIYSIVAKNGNDKTFKEMISKYEFSKDQEDKVKLLSGLYYFNKEEILIKALDYGLTKKVRPQDILYTFRSAFSNPLCQKVIFDWAKANWVNFKKYEDNKYLMREFIDTLIISQVKESAKAEIKEFFQKDKVPYEIVKANAFEILDMNLKFIEKNKDFLKNY